MPFFRFLVALILCHSMVYLVSCQNAPLEPTVRLGYFPNITHSQALVGVYRGDFSRGLGTGVKLEPTIFNAGPSVIEALFAGKIDIAYIGPSPAVNGYLKSKGAALRIIAGATSGGASLVLNARAAPGFPKTLSGLKLATPQIGNTQDVALRTYLSRNQIAAKVIPMDNPLILDAFRKGDIDGAWLPEPWASRTVLEAQGVRVLDERSLWTNGGFPTTVVIVSTAFLEAHPELVSTFLKVHQELTVWEVDHPEETCDVLNDAIASITGKPLPRPVLVEAWSKMTPTTAIRQDDIEKVARDAEGLGFLKSPIDLSGLLNLSYN